MNRKRFTCAVALCAWSIGAGLSAYSNAAETAPPAEVVLFVGSLSAQNAVDRRQGILDELEGKPVPKPAASGATIALPKITLKAGEKPRIGFVTNTAAQFWTIARAGFDKALKEFDAEGEFRISAAGTAAEQKAILEDLVTKGVHAIAISPVDPDNQTPLLNEIARNVFLITHDSDAPKSSRILYLGTVNYLAGREAGKLIKEAVGAGRPIRVVDTRTDNADSARAKANVQDVLVSRPGVACLAGLWAYNGPAIASVLREAKLAGKIQCVCFDEEAATLQAIRDGVIHATVVQKPYEFGYQAVKILAALARGDQSVIPPTRAVDTGVTVVRKSNVDEFEKWLNGLVKGTK
ncbi:MAG: substrate-binding domain-containing protein [Candidatus Sumerlaeia bacterium]|nr:substrate-binding domain-containing protein [Candidatus Sumerlaeia bacterium]